MKALAPETYYTRDQYEVDEQGEQVKDEAGNPVLKTDAKGYRIRPVSSLQFAEIMTDGFEARDGINKMKFAGVKLLLRYGLEQPTQLNEMPSIHLVEVAHAIYNKSAISEAERKN